MQKVSGLSRRLETGEQQLRRNVKRFRGGLVSKAQRLLYRPTLGLRVIKKKKKVEVQGVGFTGVPHSQENA